LQPVAVFQRLTAQARAWLNAIKSIHRANYHYFQDIVGENRAADSWNLKTSAAP